MKLRKLKKEDVPLMLEWMHDEDVVKYLTNKFKDLTIKDCERFIDQSFIDKDNIHLAIADKNDEYMGTVSLKHINHDARYCEFAITVRKKAMSKAFSWNGMYSIIKKAFMEFGLENVYWCVSKKNVRAYSFYIHHGFKETDKVPRDYYDVYCDNPNIVWFGVSKEDFLRKTYVSLPKHCSLKQITTIPTPDTGKLSFFESKEIGFDIKRVYYINEVGETLKRGFHAHKALKQFIFCPYGSINLLLDDGTNKTNIVLDESTFGVLIDGPVWREMTWFEDNSVLVVVASEFYDISDYLRDYNSFLEYIKEC